MQIGQAIEELRRHAQPGGVEGMARFGIVSSLAVLGVSVGDCRAVAKQTGRNQALALELWDAGIYEARILACFVADPKATTPDLMDRWAADFDNWAICDTACFHLFDKTSHAFAKVHQWAAREEEFVRRAAFALLASLGVHAKQLPDAEFLRALPLIERYAYDPRNFVRKGVSWALRAVGGKRAGLHPHCLAMAERLATSKNTAERWVGKDTLRDITRPMVVAKLGLTSK